MASEASLSRVSWALHAVGGAVAALLAAHVPLGMLASPGVVVLAAALVSAVASLGALSGPGARTRLAPALACARLTFALLTLSAWRGDGREVWAAVTVWVAWHDAHEKLSAERPLMPSAIALAAALAFNAMRPESAPTRAVFVGLIAALVASRASEPTSRRG